MPLVNLTVFGVELQDQVLGEIVVPEHGEQVRHGRIAASLIGEEIHFVFGTKAQLSGGATSTIFSARSGRPASVNKGDNRRRSKGPARKLGKRHQKFMPLGGH